MAHKKKGQLTTSGEWAKHLRKFMKNQFWSAERNSSKRLIREELNSVNHEVINNAELTVVWANFQNASKSGIRLNCSGTIEDLRNQNILLKNGMELLLWDEDYDDDNRKDNLIIKAVAIFNEQDKIWEGQVDWDEIRHESEIIKK